MSAQVSLVCVGARDESLSTGRLVLHVTLAGGDPCMDVGGATLRTTEGVISFMGDGYENDALVRLRCLCPALSESAGPGADACVRGGGAQCEWTIECGEGYSHISLLFSRVETEEDIDVVVRIPLSPTPHANVLPATSVRASPRVCARQSVFDGDANSNQLSRLSGSDVPPVPPLPPPHTHPPFRSVRANMRGAAQTTVETTGPTALIEFTSDETNAGLGFEASYDCIR